MFIDGRSIRCNLKMPNLSLVGKIWVFSARAAFLGYAVHTGSPEDRICCPICSRMSESSSLSPSGDCCQRASSCSFYWVFLVFVGVSIVSVFLPQQPGDSDGWWAGVRRGLQEEHDLCFCTLNRRVGSSRGTVGVALFMRPSNKCEKPLLTL